MNKETIQEAEIVHDNIDWNRVTLDFGTVAPGSKQDYSFTYIGTKKIKEVKSSCGCTSAVVNKEAKTPKVEGTYTLPTDYSYASNDITPTSKVVTVSFEDNSISTLTLSCKVNRKFNVQ